MKKVLFWLMKFALAGCLALGVLSVFALFYYNPPIRVSSDGGATDYAWEKGKFYSTFTEGFAWGRSDENGYTNVKYNEDIDVLLMGSSQMEAHNVLHTENAGYLLNEMMGESGLYTYNIGTSGHEIYNNAANMSNAVERFTPSKYLVLEVSTCVLDTEEMSRVVAGDYWHYSYYDSGLLYYAQKVPFARLAYRQLKNMNSAAEDNTTVSSVSKADEQYKDTVDEFIAYMQAIAEENGIHLVLLYHNAILLEDDGTAVTEREEKKEYYNALKSACDINGVSFVDVTDKFLAEYNENYVLPYGFSNSEIGTGHLNKEGHRIIAEELYSFLNKREGIER